MTIDPGLQLPGGAATVNEQFFDAMIRHQIGLLRLSGSIRNQIFKILDASEADMADQIRRRLVNHKGFTTSASVRRMETLLKVIRARRVRAWRQVDKIWMEELRQLARTEPAFVSGALKTVSPAVIDTVIPSTQLLTSIVTTKPFEGKVMSKWASGVRRADLDRISDQVRIGMIQGEPSAAIARRVVGTVQARGTNGVTEITRRNAAAITRTAVNAVANQAKRAFYTANAAVFSKELYTATLDGRTTPICRSLDGKQFTIGEGPIPPLHFNCRSLRVAVVSPEAIGSRPARAVTQKQLIREFSKKQGLTGIKDRAGLPRGTKGAFDSFSRARMRELTGTVPAKVSYQQWLTRQPRSFQVDVLGKTRAALFRKGGLKLDKFVNRAGDEIPLSQLAKIERKAFLDAGLDPEDFL